MKRTNTTRLFSTLTVCVAGALAAACGGGSQTASSSDTTLMANGEACATPWASTAVYVGGNRASYSGVNYTAAYWTQGDNPATHSGAAGSGQPWVAGFLCGSTTAGTTTTTKASTTTTKASTTTTKATTTSTGGSSTTTSTVNSTTTTSILYCPGVVPYVAGNAYATGARVSNVSRIFTCNVGGWCSSSPAAFAPGVGWAWTQAWTEGASCDGATPILFQSINNTQMSGITTAQNVVVKDAANWATLWNTHTQYKVPQPALPAVDFSQKTVLGVFLGSRPDTCYSVKIESVTTAAGRITVNYKETGPATPTTACGTAITNPADIVSIDKTTLPVDFVKK